MSHKIVAFLIVSFFFLVSCKDDEVQRKFEQVQEQKKQEKVFEIINKNWQLNGSTLNASSQNLTQNWPEWRVFLKEIGQKPKSSIGAFKKKAKILSLKVADLNNNIPENYNKPEIKSRIAAVATKINSLNLFINLNAIPEQKVLALIPEINQEIQSLQFQFGEIDQKSQIKIEDGEADMIKMLDTTRAIPSSKNSGVPQPSIDPNQPQKRRPLIPIK
jgi:hypothetical protein